MSSRTLFASLVSLGLHLACLFWWQWHAQGPHRRPTILGPVHDARPPITVRLLPQAPLPEARQTAREGPTPAVTPPPARPPRSTPALALSPPRASPPDAEVRRTAGTAREQAVLHGTIRHGASAAASTTSVAPPVHHEVPAPRDLFPPAQTAETRHVPPETTLRDFARRHAQAAERDEPGPPPPATSGERQKRAIDKLYDQAHRGHRQAWVEHRANDGTSVVRFAAGTCSRITAPPDHEHRHLNKTIQVMDCPD